MLHPGAADWWQAGPARASISFINLVRGENRHAMRGMETKDVECAWLLLLLLLLLLLIWSSRGWGRCTDPYTRRTG